MDYRYLNKLVDIQVSNNLKTKNMKSLLLIILTSFSFMTIAVGQNLPVAKKLDEKNGFKEFQIGDSFQNGKPI